MIRAATPDDVDAIVRLSHAFYKTTAYRNAAPMCADTVDDLTRWLIENGVILVAESAGKVVGMVGLAVGPFMFNREATTAHEVVWYVSPEVRGGTVAVRLLRAAEAACRDKGCAAMQMVTLASSPDVATRMYERAGLVRSETCFTKEL